MSGPGASGVASTEGGSTPLHATVVNCFSDNNKGSAALVAGLITRLRATGRVGPVTVVALAHEIEPRRDFRHLLRAFPDVTIVASPLRDAPNPRAGHGVAKNAAPAAYAAYITARTLDVGAEVALRRFLRDPAFHAIVHSDLVLERGGPFFKGLGPPPNPSLLRYAWPLHLAAAAGVPYGLVGESVGPLVNPWARRVVRRLFLGAGLAAVREDTSREALAEAGVPDERVTTMLDNAFWTRPRHSPAVASLLTDNGLAGAPFLAVTCRDRPDASAERAYLQEMAASIDELVPATFPLAAIVPNTFNPAGEQHDDRRIAHTLHKYVERPDLVRVLDADLAPDELVALYGEAALVIGHRLHSLILGVTGGTPVVGLSSSLGPKTVGVMRLLGLHDYVVRVGELRRGDLAPLAQRAVHGQPEVAARVDALRRRSDAEFSAFVDRVGSSAGRRPRPGAHS